MRDDTDALTGQVAVVTGGGSGIGLAIATALAADGATTVIAGRRTATLATARAEIEAAHPAAHVVGVEADVTSESSVRDLFAEASDLGPVTMVVANAGFGSAGPFHLTSLDEWNAVLATNLTGAFLTMRTAAPHLVRSGGGSIVAVSSIAGVSTHRYMTPYCVSKAGLEMLVRQVADELGSAGVRANAVRPGLVPTDATSGMLAVPEIVDDYMAQMPLGRAGHVDEVAALVRFLLGSQSSWITGSCIDVDGGHHLRRGPDLGPVMAMLHPDDLMPGAGAESDALHTAPPA